MWDTPGELDRLERELRLDDDFVAQCWADGVILRLGDGSTVPVTATADPGIDWLIDSRHLLDQATRTPTTELRLAVQQSADSAYDPQRYCLLGCHAGQAYFVDRQPGEPGLDLRLAIPLLSVAEAEAAMMAAALVNWHELEGYCPRCGRPSQITSAGTSRHCDHCHQDLFPRTDPAVIVAVFDDDDRILLAHQRIWEQARYSIVAGFVEAGESLEQAVYREVAEEVGVTVDRVEYIGSQPWPMPRSLMLGFNAHAAQTRLKPDGSEIQHARWFSRADIPQAVDDGSLRLPGPASIAFRLISRWLNAAG